MNTTTIENNVKTTFIRMTTTKAMKALVKQLADAGYVVEAERMSDIDDAGPVCFYKVSDGEALVAKGVMMRQNVWAVTMSNKYFVEPTF